jgi:hypothetical protein
VIWLRRVGFFLDYKNAYSKESECTENTKTIIWLNDDKPSHD